jgi:hypothetical protein
MAEDGSRQRRDGRGSIAGERPWLALRAPAGAGARERARGAQPVMQRRPQAEAVAQPATALSAWWRRVLAPRGFGRIFDGAGTSQCLPAFISWWWEEDLRLGSW